ncbi:trypsin-like peptidase domain-containing protein [Gemmobacter serpentinus]|uniref:trypsin-like peptidase domain-containing protein n=1 Tax=Gemmobacter serpentinus TaxID=2652247 RepID=UPI00124DC827|nr:trypsin-like peptidase domain-containing protein [Gemmobacter serpentinus]
MKQVICLLALLGSTALTPAFAPAAWSQTAGGGVAQEMIWLQIEAQPSMDIARERASAYAAVFPDVSGFATGGWYAIALGPYTDRGAAEARLRQLKDEALVPADSFIAFGRDYRAAFWPEGQTSFAPLDGPPLGATEPGETPIIDSPIAQAPIPAPDGAMDPAADPAPEAPLAAAPEAAQPAFIEETPAEARAAEARLDQPAREMIQTALQWFGHYNARIDGAIGPGTRASMTAWQTANGLEPTGILTTMQRETLIEAYQHEQAAFGLSTITEAEAGIEITLPTAMVEFDHYEPPFVHYRAKNNSGVQVILISQPGDQATLYGLYDVLQTLEVVPVTGERARSERSFTIDGRSANVASHAYAELSKGLIKGYIVAWNPSDDDKMARVLTAMQSSFRSIGDKALDPGLVPLSDDSRSGLLSGLEVRRPALSRSGFYVDGNGTVATVAEAVEGCNRITLDLKTEASVIAADAVTGLALLKPAKPLSPPAVAELLPGSAREGQEIAVSGYSYEDRLPAPAMTFGTLEEGKGLDGETGIARLTLDALAGDAGGPVLDATGAVIGMLLPRSTEGARKLPASVAYALQAAPLAARLTEAGVTPRPSARSGALAPEDLNRLSDGMTVLVSCW